MATFSPYTVDVSTEAYRNPVFDSSATWIILGVIGVVSAIVVTAVALFLKKKGKVGSEAQKDGKISEAKKVKVEDGMVEIELDSQPNTQHAQHKR